MSLSGRESAERAKLPYDLAALRVELGLLRVGHLLSREQLLFRKYDPDQPRTPAGETGAGQWTSGDGGQEVVADDGSRVLSLRIRSRPSETWDEQHGVVAPDGTRTLFEMEGRTQTIRDGETGEILSRATLVDGQVEPEAFVQNARAPDFSGSRIKATVEAALALLSVLSLRKSRDGTAIFEAPASAYEPGADANHPAMWVGRVDQAELDAACPRRGEVQGILDDSVTQVRATGNFMDAQDFGNKVHAVAAAKIRALNDPNLVQEISYIHAKLDLDIPEKPSEVPYGTQFSIRLDALEKSDPLTVCIHDFKTGKSGLAALRATQIARMVAVNFPGTQRIIVNEIRPSR